MNDDLTVSPQPFVWNGDSPFIDPEELADPRLHLWREILRRRYNFNKTRATQNKIDNG
jgi:hypothetical protein